MNGSRRGKRCSYSKVGLYQRLYKYKPTITKNGDIKRKPRSKRYPGSLLPDILGCFVNVLYMYMSRDDIIDNFDLQPLVPKEVTFLLCPISILDKDVFLDLKNREDKRKKLGLSGLIYCIDTPSHQPFGRFHDVQQGIIFLKTDWVKLLDHVYFMFNIEMETIEDICKIFGLDSRTIFEFLN